jgi:hypothetical protein
LIDLLLSHYFVSALVAAVSTTTVFAIERNCLGPLLMAIRDDENAAPMVGINAFHLKAFAKVISGAMAGIAGSLYLSVYRIIDPNIAFGVSAVLNPVLRGSWEASRPREVPDEEYRNGFECEGRRFMAPEERIRELHEKGGYDRSLRKNKIVASLGTRRI